MAKKTVGGKSRGGRGKGGGRSVAPGQAADVIRGVLETFYPRGAKTAEVATYSMVSPKARWSDPGQDPSTLTVVLTDSVTDATDPTGVAVAKSAGVPALPAALARRVDELCAKGAPSSKWAEVVRKDLLRSLAEAYRETNDPARRAAIEEAIAHISTRWT